MRIGILTFHRGPNYGGFLQAWHMRQAIRSLGHEATLINYQTRTHHEGESLSFPRLRPGSIKGFILHALKSRPFPAIVAELSDHPFTTDAERIDWSRFSSVVVGADIVWDFSNKYFGDDPAFFGSLPCQAGTRFVGFAPSCGEAEAKGQLPAHVSRGLQGFKSIQVRDEATADLVENATGKRPPLVVDPTWLQADPEIPYPKRPKEPYALVYGHGVTAERARALRKYCDHHGLKLVACAFPCEGADKRILTISPFEWVDLFRHATCVITSTFHGLLYAIKYQKPLLFMARDASRSKSRLAIDRCGLQDRTIEDGMPFDPEQLDHALSPYNPTQPPESWIQESREALSQSLQE